MFPVAFEYLARRFVKVTLVGTSRQEMQLNVDYRFISKTEIESTIAWTPGEFQTIEIRRVTSSTDRLVNFTDGSILRSQDLNISQIQAIHIAEEGRDVAENSMISGGFFWDALGLPIKNVGNPALPTDAANGQYVLDNIRTALRVTPSETISEIPSDRANKVLAFDANRQPVALIPSTGSSMELELKLQDPASGLNIIKSRKYGGRVRTAQDQANDVLYLSDFCEFGDGRDETTMAQLAFNVAKAQGRRLVGRPGWRVGLSSTMTIDINTRYEGDGTWFVPMTAFTTGTMIQVAGVSNRAPDINGLRAICPKGGRGDLVGVTIGTPTGEIACWDPSSWIIEGFHINARFAGNNVYIIHFQKSKFLGATLRNISWECKTNSGESITFDGGSISDAKNASNTAVGIYVDPAAASVDMRVTRGSMSYNDFNGDIAKGKIELFGVHEENRNVNPFWRLRTTANSEKTVFGKYGGSITSGPLSAGTEPKEGRDALIVYDGAVSIAVRDAKLGTFREGSSGPNRVDDYKTVVAKHSGVGGAAYSIKISGDIDGNRSSSIPINICAEIDQVWLKGPTAFSGFAKNSAGGISFEEGTDGHLLDARSRGIISSTGTSGSYNLQRIQVRPGQTLVAKVSAKTVGATTCSYAGGRLMFYTQTDELIVTQDLARTILTPTNAAYLIQYAHTMVPAGAAYVVFQMLGRDINGTVRFSNERLWVID